MLFWADVWPQKHKREKHNWILTINFPIQISSICMGLQWYTNWKGYCEGYKFYRGISGTTFVLVDGKNLFGNISLKKINLKTRTRARETHEVFWQKYLIGVTKSSNVSVPNNISLNKLQRYANNYLFKNYVSRNKSVKIAIWPRKEADNEELVAPTYDIFNKNVCYLTALQHLGITQNSTEQITKFETA